MRDFLALLKALSDPTRLRLLLALRGRELCACQLVALCGLAGSTVSRHLALLHRAGLVVSRKDERWVHYRLPGREAPAAVREALDWVHKSLHASAEAAQDRKELRAILKTDRRVICQRLNQS